ncbi:MAG: flagellar hook-length control protein FliK [Spirochaetia bacterium]|nr:flagellar hook-length control protein FliK [Spirochaetia bacterium]
MFPVNPINQIFSQPLINETSGDKYANEIRKSRSSLFDDFKNEPSMTSSFNNNSFLTMIQNSFLQSSTIQETPAITQNNHTSETTRENSNDLNSYVQDKSLTKEPEKLADKTDKNNFEKHTENKNIQSKIEKPNNEELKNSSLKPDKTNHFKTAEKDQIAASNAVNAEKAIALKNEKNNEKLLSVKDIKELFSKDIKLLNQKKEINVSENQLINASRAVNSADKNNEKGFEKNKTSVFDKLHLKNNIQETKNEKTLLEADKSQKSASLKNKYADHKTNVNSDDLKTASQIVSRETISLAASDKKQISQNDNLSSKNLNAEKAIVIDNIKSNLKSNLDSDSPTGQQHSGYSTHGAERFNFMNKVDDNLALRNNLQQQIDQMMQKAKVIIRENGNAQLSTKLNPGELGEISIKLTLIDGKLTGKFTVDNDFVQKELNGKLDKIFAELKSEGYVVDGFQVDVKSQSGQEKNFNETLLSAEDRNARGIKLNSLQENSISDYNSSDFELNKQGEIYA